MCDQMKMHGMNNIKFIIIIIIIIAAAAAAVSNSM
jgi:hypothetical protein